MASVTKRLGQERGTAPQTTELEVTIESEVAVRHAEPLPAVHSPTTKFGLFFVGLLALFIVFAVTWGAAWAALPALIPGWTSAAIMSGSMSPSIRTGDVVVASSSDGENLGLGTVVMFEGPSRPGYVTHRIVEINEDGTYTTQGDANPGADSTPLRPEQVVGTGRILVPLIGLPYVWISNEEWVTLAVSAVVMLLALWLSRYAFIDPFGLSIRGDVRARKAEPAHGSE